MFRFLDLYNWHSSNNNGTLTDVRIKEDDGWEPQAAMWAIGEPEAYLVTFVILSKSLSFSLSKSVFISSLAWSFFPLNFTDNFS